MKLMLLALGLSTISHLASAADFARATSFQSVTAFVADAKTFQPAATKSDLSALFTVRELGQPEDPKTGTTISAQTIESSSALWSDDTQAIVFVTATPPTEATRSFVGVLFLLTQERGSWRIADLLRFAATGKYAEVSAEITGSAGTGSGVHDLPIVTVKESDGGRGYSSQRSATYTVESSRFQRMELK